MEEEKILSIRDIARNYLDYNGLTVAYMARVTHVPKSTLHEWLNGERELRMENLIKVKQFLQGNFLLDVETIVNHMLLQMDAAEEEENAN